MQTVNTFELPSCHLTHSAAKTNTADYEKIPHSRGPHDASPHHQPMTQGQTNGTIYLVDAAGPTAQKISLDNNQIFRYKQFEVSGITDELPQTFSGINYLKYYNRNL